MSTELLVQIDKNRVYCLTYDYDFRGTEYLPFTEKLNRQKTAAEKKLIAAQHREKQLEHELKRLTRSERTHRLCTRAGMLEKFLREPALLTDDDVMELLTFLFHGEAAQKKLDTLIEERRKSLTTDGGENPLF